LEPREGLVEELAAVVGPNNVLEDEHARADYEVDWTGRYKGRARLVVRPGTPEEVARSVVICGQGGASIVPQGGNTGLVGGAVPVNGEVVISLRRMNRLVEVDAGSGQVVAEAGVTLATLAGAAAQAGWRFGIDFAARDSATVGGMIATNAGGLHVMRHGSMREQIIGIEAVLADGQVIGRLSGLLKDNTGYHLPSLLAGSEGTLGIITRACLKLVRRDSSRASALIGVDGPEQAEEIVNRLRQSCESLAAAELILENGLSLVLKHQRRERPLPEHPAYVLVETASNRDAETELVDALADIGVVSAVLAAGANEQRRLWELREGLTDAISAVGVPHKFDVSLPAGRIRHLMAKLPDLVAAIEPNAVIVVFGHLGDRNLHINVLGLGRGDGRVDDVVLRAVLREGGSISAEHGIGRAKRRWLPFDRSRADLAAMRAIKASLDPRGIFNPGVLFA